MAPEKDPPNKESSHAYDSSVEVFQMRFKDSSDGVTEISAWELADAIEGVAGFAEEMAKKGVFGEGIQPEVLVRPMQEGSFVIDFLVPVANYFQENQEGIIAGAVGGAGTLFYDQIRTGINQIRGITPTDFEHLNNGMVKIHWQDGVATETTEEAWTELQTMRKKTRKNLEKIISPLRSSADTVEFRGGAPEEDTEQIMDSTPIASIDSSEYREVVTAPHPVDEYEQEISAEATFESVDFKPGGKWRIASTAGKRQVTIEDENFLRLLDSGLKIGKDDIYEVTIKETQTVSAGRTNVTWALTNIRRTREGTGESLN